MTELNKKNMVKEIMETNNIFNSCDSLILRTESTRLLDYYEDYTPNKKRVIHNFLSNILHKKILSEGDYNLLKSHVNLLLEKINNNEFTVHDYLWIDTLIYIIDKVFLYSLKLDNSLLNNDKKKQDFRYKILFYLDKNKKLSEYIKLYKQFSEIEINDIFYIKNESYLNYFVVKGFIINNQNDGYTHINRIILFTYDKNDKNAKYGITLRIPYFYFLGLDIKKIKLDQIEDNDNKKKISDIYNLDEKSIKTIIPIIFKNNITVNNSKNSIKYTKTTSNGTTITTITRNIKLNN